MTDRKRAPKMNALNVERADYIVQIIRYAFDALVTVIPPTPKLYAAREMFLAWADDFSCFRLANYAAPAQNIVSSVSLEKTDLDEPETLVPGTLPEL